MKLPVEKVPPLAVEAQGVVDTDPESPLIPSGTAGKAVG